MININLLADSKNPANIVNYNGKLRIVLSNLPKTANNVRIVLNEVSSTNDEATTARKLMTIKGSISDKKFILSEAPTENFDPLAADPFANSNFQNPEFHKQGDDYSTSTPKLIVIFNSKEFELELPDRKEEKPFYEISAECYIGDKLDSKLSGKIQVRRPIDTMIVPDIGLTKKQTNGELEDHRSSARFGDQWLKYAKARRSIVKVGIDSTLQAFENSVITAAGISKYGKVILLTGHGATGEGAIGEDGNPLPRANNRFHITAFDTTPSSIKGMINHSNKITAEELSFPDIAEKQADGTWKYKDEEKVADEKLIRLGKKVDMLLKIRDAFKKNNVTKFIVVSCNVGNDPEFGSKLAKILKTPVGLYRDFVVVDAIMENGNDAFVQCYLSGGTIPPQDENHLSTRDIPSGCRTFNP
ncbi:MAG: hypothetical protein GX639_09140 [Fibrobacter sp.]|nr:hypothetical protein [Fibrobacter sp.]